MAKSLAQFVKALGIAKTNEIMEKLIIQLEDEKIPSIERIGMS